MDNRRQRIIKDLGLGVVAFIEFSLVLLVLGWGVGFSPVLSGSMGASLPPGSIAVTAKALTKEVKVDDIIRLPFPEGEAGEYVHRVIDIQTAPDGFLVKTKGDANPTADSWQVRIVSAYTPRVVGYIPLLGYLHPWTNHVWARTGLMATIAALLGLATYRLVRKAVMAHSVAASS